MKATNRRHQSTTDCYQMYVPFDAGIASSVCMLIVVSQSCSIVHEESMMSNFSAPFPSQHSDVKIYRQTNSRHPIQKRKKRQQENGSWKPLKTVD